MEVERHGFHHAGARELLIEIDLWFGLVETPEEPDQARKLIVSRSALQMRLDEREVRRFGADFHARLGACAERQ
jgi:hypothetical protein